MSCRSYWIMVDLILCSLPNSNLNLGEVDWLPSNWGRVSPWVVSQKIPTNGKNPWWNPWKATTVQLQPFGRTPNLCDRLRDLRLASWGEPAETDGLDSWGDAHVRRVKLHAVSIRSCERVQEKVGFFKHAFHQSQEPFGSMPSNQSGPAHPSRTSSHLQALKWRNDWILRAGMAVRQDDARLALSFAKARLPSSRRWSKLACHEKQMLLQEPLLVAFLCMSTKRSVDPSDSGERFEKSTECDEFRTVRCDGACWIAVLNRMSRPSARHG